MIDIHTHILPGVDDGAESMEDALIMAEMAAKSGVSVIAATCHSNQEGFFENYESVELRKQYLRLRKALEQEKIPITLVRGMEIFASADMGLRMKDGDLISLNSSRYYLVEFGFSERPEIMDMELTDLMELGFRPVLAHPERYYCVQDDPNVLYHLRRKGVVAQLNKGSIAGRFGPKSQQCAEVLLKHQLVNCVASDAHRPYARTTDMRKISEYLSNHYSEKYRNLLTRVVPSKILMNKPLPEMEPIPVERRRWF